MRSIFLMLLALCIAGSCRERYGLPMEEALYNSLVVEGNILKGDTTIIRLSRATAVNDRKLLPQTGATIRVEGDDNISVTLSETEPGVYKVAPIDLKPSTNYRLKITTGGKDYESDWTSLINTADIDSVFWERNNGVEIFVKSSGNAESNRYYKWDYDEVYEFYAKYQSRAYYTYVVNAEGNRVAQCVDTTVNGQVYTTCVKDYGLEGAVYNDTMYHCWKYGNSTNINIGSTAALTENVILAPIRKIEEDGIELSNLYSILVKQTGLSKEAYEFYNILKGNTEGMGSIFDPQPSQLKTNLRCVTDPAERVIGFVNTTAVKSKRLFISRMGLEDWFYYDTLACVLDTIFGNSAEQVADQIGKSRLPVKVLGFELTPPKRVVAYTTASKFCVDCRVRGEHRKPEFWP